MIPGVAPTEGEDATSFDKSFETICGFSNYHTFTEKCLIKLDG